MYDRPSPVTHKIKVQPNCHCVCAFRAEVGEGGWLPGQVATLLSSPHVAWRPVEPSPCSWPGSRQGLTEIDFRLERNSKSCLGSEGPNPLRSLQEQRREQHGEAQPFVPAGDKVVRPGAVTLIESQSRLGLTGFQSHPSLGPKCWLASRHPIPGSPRPPKGGDSLL